MPLIPWKYLIKYLDLSATNPTELTKKLTASGLETNLISRMGETYLEFTILANRPDLLTWWGVVREIGVLGNYLAQLPILTTRKKPEKKFIKILINTGNCREFQCGLVKNIKIGESSPEIKNWLIANNIHPTNNLVDLANLVRLETGQPLHIFDYDSLDDKKVLVVRQAQSGEKMITQLGKELIFSAEDIVLSSGEKIIAGAGMSESQETALTTQTKNILINCASGTKKSQVNQHFNKGVNLSCHSQPVLLRIISLIKELLGEKITTKIALTYYAKKPALKSKLITISHQFLEKKIGQTIAPAVIENAWKQLNFVYQKKLNTYQVSPPFYRSDIIRAEDLVEEILRIYDYNQISGSLPSWQEITPFPTNNFGEQKEKIRTFLVNSGWQEIITYSLVSATAREKDFSAPPKPNFYQLLAPKSENHRYYRQTLIPSHSQTIYYNWAHDNKNCLFFEISSIYASASLATYQEELITLSATGKIFNQPVHQLVQEVDLAWIKGVCENIFTLCLIEQEITFRPPTSSSNPSVQAEIFLVQEKIGYLGLLTDHKNKEPLFFAQISWTKISNYLVNFPGKIAYCPVSSFPTSEKDLSLVFSENINYHEVIKEIKKAGGEDLGEVVIFDVYQNEELAQKGRKSVSFHLIFQSANKTLTKTEIEKNLTRIEEKLTAVFATKIRK